MSDHQKIEPSSNTLYAEDKNVLKKTVTVKMMGKVVKQSKTVVKATGRCMSSANCDRGRNCIKAKNEKYGVCFGQQETSAKVCKFEDKAQS